MKPIKYVFVLALLFASLGVSGVFASSTASAADHTSQTTSLTPTGTCDRQGIQIIPAWYHYLDRSVDSTGHCGLEFDFPDDIGLVLLAIVEILLRLAAIVSVAFVIIGGFRYITSQGEPDKAKGAQQTITNAIIGLVIAMLATGVVAFIGGRLT